MTHKTYPNFSILIMNVIGKLFFRDKGCFVKFKIDNVTVTMI